MIKLINRGRYDTPVLEEFEHLTQRLSAFLSQIFDENGVPIPPDEGGSIDVAATLNVRVHHGDIAINNGNLVGYSILPWSPNLTRTTLHHLGVHDNQGYPGPQVSIRFDVTTSPGQTIVKGERGYTVGNANVSYCVCEYLQPTARGAP